VTPDGSLIHPCPITRSSVAAPSSAQQNMPANSHMVCVLPARQELELGEGRSRSAVVAGVVEAQEGTREARDAESRWRGRSWRGRPGGSAVGRRPAAEHAESRKKFGDFDWSKPHRLFLMSYFFFSLRGCFTCRGSLSPSKTQHFLCASWERYSFCHILLSHKYELEITKRKKIQRYPFQVKIYPLL
jgi:hypothetical protein